MMSKEMKPIDLRKLATNFANEKSKEERYKQRNDAKFRAVHQRCSTYDEFRQIVEASHLRPLDRNETLTLERQSIAWNQPATNKSSELILPLESLHIHPINYSIPKNLTEFIQQWRRISANNQLDYLHRINNLEILFQRDIPIDFLHDLSLLYQTNCSYNDAELIRNILCYLIKSKRFELIQSFLTDKDKIELDRLFLHLSSFVHLRFSIFLIRYVYL